MTAAADEAAAILFEQVSAGGDINVGVYIRREERPALFTGVPTMPPHFVGREDLVDALVTRLTSGEERSVALEGPPGVGKTALAVALVHHRQVLAYFKDGILWASLGPQGQASSTLVNWGEDLGEDLSQLAELEERRQAVKHLIGQRSLLLVIDDVWDIETARALQCGGPNCCHLLTSRESGIARSFAGHRQTSAVPTLDEDAAYLLLEELAPDACAADPEACRQLGRAAGGLPLVLDLLGGYLAAPERSLFPDLSSEAMKEMADPARRLALASVRLGARQAGQVTLKDTILLSLESLPDEVQAAFYALGTFAPKPEHFTREAAEVVADTSARSLALLAARNLLEVTGEQLAMHQIVADLARSGTTSEAAANHRDYYLSLVNRDPEDWQMIASVYGQISWAWQRLPEDENLLEWVGALNLFQDRRGMWQDILAWSLRGLQVAETEGMSCEQAILLNTIGSVYDNLGQRQRALEYCQQALSIFEKVGDRAGLAITLSNLGAVYDELGQRQQAMDYYQRALPIYEEVNDRAGLATTLSNLGLVYDNLGQRQRALEYYQQALPITEEVGDWDRLATTLNNLGLVHDNLGQWHQAIEYHQQALSIREEIGDRPGLAITLNNLGSVHDKLGQRQRALEYYQQALPIFEGLGDRPGLAITLSNIGVIYNELGQIRQALEYYQQALPIYEEVGDGAGLAATLSNLGLAYENLGQREQAIAYYQEALPITEEVGDRAGLAVTLNNLGSVYHKQGQSERAIEYYQQALPITEEVGDRAGLASILHNLGSVYDKLEKGQRALEYYQKALPIFEEVGDPAGLAVTLNSLGSLYDELGQRQQALEHFRQAMTISEEMGDRAGLATTLYRLASMHKKLGQKQQAIRYYQQALTIFEEVGARYEESITRYNLGLLYRSLDRLEEAVDELRKLVDLDRRMGYPDLESDLDLLRQAEDELRKRAGAG